MSLSCPVLGSPQPEGPASGLKTSGALGPGRYWALVPMGPSLVRRRATQRPKVDMLLPGDPGTLVGVNPVSDGVNVPGSLSPGQESLPLSRDSRSCSRPVGHPAWTLLPANDVAREQSHSTSLCLAPPPRAHAQWCVHQPGAPVCTRRRLQRREVPAFCVSLRHFRMPNSIHLVISAILKFWQPFLLTVHKAMSSNQCYLRFT